MKSWGFSRMRKQWIPGHFSLRPRGLGTRLAQEGLDTISLFPGSCAQEGGKRDYLVYTHASCIAENFVA